MKRIILLILLFITFFLVSPVYAQKEVFYHGVINGYKEIPCFKALEGSYKCFEYYVDIEELNDQKVISPILSENEESRFRKGDKVFVSFLSDEYGNEEYCFNPLSLGYT